MTVTSNPSHHPQPHPSLQIIDAPDREETNPGNKSIFFSGSIKSSMDRDWQAELTTSLSHFPVTIFNPRRPDWDSSWVEDIQDLRFRNQVEWELDHIKAADLVICYFAADGLSAVSMLEFGLCVSKLQGEGKGTMLVCCEPGYVRRGNIQVVCARYGIRLLEELDGLGEEVVGVLEL